jgi:3-dehydroquinate synthase
MSSPVIEKSIPVSLKERSYVIELGTGNLSRAGEILAAFPDVRHTVILTDQNVERPYAEMAAESFAGRNIAVDLLVIEPGEESKSIETASLIWEKMLELGAGRQTVMTAVGGGVVGDLTGFIAATYARGIRFFQIPTTLLAQVDSSVGGKVGVNLPAGKNMVGAFHQPLGVLIDTKTLETLDGDQFRSGLGEIVKYGVSLSAELFELLDAHAAEILCRDHTLLSEIIARCCQIKADIVTSDEKETSGLRAKLNYGHTFAHAYETAAGYGTLPHGLAVAIGCVDAAKLARLLGRVDPCFVERQIALNTKFDLPIQYKLADTDEAIRIMQRDKKADPGILRFVLPATLGKCEIVSDVPRETVRQVLK